MIVKDEEEMLPDCLASCADGVDEMVIVDTGSTDRTVEIAESFGATVLHFAWNGSFSDARNHGVEAATGTHILWLDADERLEDGDAAGLRELAAQPWREAHWLVETNFTGQEEVGTAADAPRAAALAATARRTASRARSTSRSASRCRSTCRSGSRSRSCASATTATSRAGSRSATSTSAT